MLIKCDMCGKMIDTDKARPDGTPAGATLCLSDGSKITTCSECIEKTNKNPEYLDEFLKKREEAENEIKATINPEERNAYELKILHEAIQRYGVDSQVDMAIEEMSELTKALLKFRRAVNSKQIFSGLEWDSMNNAILEEMADVQIMLDQLYIIYGVPTKDRFYKINRLKERLEK